MSNRLIPVANRRFICLYYLLLLFVFLVCPIKSKVVSNPLNVIKSSIVASCSPNNVVELVANLMLMKATKGKLLKNADNVLIPKDFNVCDVKYKDRIIQKMARIQGDFFDNKPFKLHRCKRNETEAAARQFSCQVEPDLKNVNELKNVIRDLIIPVIERSENVSPTPVMDYDLWINSFSGIKKKSYLEAYQKFLAGDKYNGSTYMNTVKIDEKIFINPVTFKTKARNITAQTEICKIIIGHFIDHVSLVCKNSLQSYGSGLRAEDRCEKFLKWTQHFGGDYKIVCVDGQAYDATRHKVIQEVIDVQIYKWFMERFKLELFKSPVSPHVIEEVLYILDQMVYGKNYKYLIYGTQATGRMNTTNGNTLSNIGYQTYICHKAGLKWKRDYFFEAAGDDTFIIIRGNKYKLYIKAAWSFCYTDDASKPIVHGLGQACKFFDLFDTIQGSEYLSCYLLQSQTDDKIYMIRKPERFLQLTSWTYNNKHTNLRKAHRLNAELACMEGLNILSQQDFIPLYRALAYQGIRTGNHKISNTTRKKFNLESNKHNDLRDSRSANLSREFNQLMFDKFLINEGEINNLISDLNSSSNLYDIIQTPIIDKLFSVGSYSDMAHSKFDDVNREFIRMSDKKLIYSDYFGYPDF